MRDGPSRGSTVGLRAKLLSGRVRVHRGTPRTPLTASALFLTVTRVKEAPNRRRVIATLSMARPAANGYLIKELMSDMQLEPEAAVEKAIDIALRGGIRDIYLNADLAHLPANVPFAG
jgi:hypothetical protein